jgi:hypothetical protein
MSEQKPTNSDPTPEERVGDSSIKPVVIAFIVTIAVILVAALVFLKAHQSKVVPKVDDQHPTSQIMRPQPVQPSTQPKLSLAA